MYMPVWWVYRPVMNAERAGEQAFDAVMWRSKRTDFRISRERLGIDEWNRSSDIVSAGWRIWSTMITRTFIPAFGFFFARAAAAVVGTACADDVSNAAAPATAATAAPRSSSSRRVAPPSASVGSSGPLVSSASICFDPVRSGKPHQKAMRIMIHITFSPARLRIR